MAATTLVKLAPAGSANLTLNSCGLAASAALSAAMRPCSSGVLSALVCQYSSSTGDDGNCGDCPAVPPAVPHAARAAAPAATDSAVPNRRTSLRFILTFIL